MDYKSKDQHITGKKSDSVKVKVGESEDFRRIGSCLVEDVIGKGALTGQPENVQVCVLYNKEDRYIRILPKEAAFNRNITSAQHAKMIAKEKYLSNNLTLSHADKCPQFELSRLEENFDLSGNTLTSMRVSVCGLIFDKDNRVLLTKRTPDMRTYPRCWVFPGGGVEPGESILGALYREIQEEVGLDIIEDYKQQQDQEQVVVLLDEDEDDMEFEEEEGEDQYQSGNNGNIKQKISSNSQNKRETRLQSKLQSQQKTKSQDSSQTQQPATNNNNKSKLKLKCSPKLFFVYETTYPTDIRISYPQRSSLVLFYGLETNQIYSELQLSQQKSEVDYSAWVPLNTLCEVLNVEGMKSSTNSENTQENSIQTQSIDTGVSLNQNYFSIGLNSFIGKYPNLIGEGIGEAHIKAIKMAQELKIKNNNKL